MNPSLFLSHVIHSSRVCRLHANRPCTIIRVTRCMPADFPSRNVGKHAKCMRTPAMICIKRNKKHVYKVAEMRARATLVERVTSVRAHGNHMQMHSAYICVFPSTRDGNRIATHAYICAHCRAVSPAICNAIIRVRHHGTRRVCVYRSAHRDMSPVLIRVLNKRHMSGSPCRGQGTGRLACDGDSIVFICTCRYTRTAVSLWRAKNV